LATERWRAVLDTDVMIAALKSRQPASPTAELLRRWVAGEFEVIYSAALQAEYEEKIAARAIDPVRAAGFLADLQAHGVPIEVGTVEYDPHFLPLGDRNPSKSRKVTHCLYCSHSCSFSVHLLSIWNLRARSLKREGLACGLSNLKRPIGK
jgi:hypothetical protein